MLGHCCPRLQRFKDSCTRFEGWQAVPGGRRVKCMSGPCAHVHPGQHAWNLAAANGIPAACRSRASPGHWHQCHTTRRSRQSPRWRRSMCTASRQGGPGVWNASAARGAPLTQQRRLRRHPACAASQQGFGCCCTLPPAALGAGRDSACTRLLLGRPAGAHARVLHGPRGGGWRAAATSWAAVRCARSGQRLQPTGLNTMVPRFQARWGGAASKAWGRAWGCGRVPHRSSGRWRRPCKLRILVEWLWDASEGSPSCGGRVVPTDAQTTECLLIGAIADSLK